MYYEAKYITRTGDVMLKETFPSLKCVISSLYLVTNYIFFFSTTIWQPREMIHQVENHCSRAFQIPSRSGSLNEDGNENEKRFPFNGELRVQCFPLIASPYRNKSACTNIWRMGLQAQS